MSSSRCAHHASNARSSASSASAKASRVCVLLRWARARYAGGACRSDDGCDTLAEALAKIAAANLRKWTSVVARDANEEMTESCAPAVRCRSRGAVEES